MTGRRPHEGAPHFLLVEDNDLVARACQRALEQHGAVSLAGSVAEGIIVVATVRLTGLVADIALPDGSGLEVAMEARARMPDLPILIISGDVDPARLDIADELGASYLLKPIERWQLKRFAERAIARLQRASALIHGWVVRYGLTEAETATLRLALDGLRREEIARVRMVSRSTVKHQVASLLAKVSAESLSETRTLFYQELSGAGRR